MIEFLPELRDPVEAEWRRHLADDLKTLSCIPSGFVAAKCELFRSDPARYNIDFLMRYAEGELSSDERQALWERCVRIKSTKIWYSPVSEWKPGLRSWIEKSGSKEERQRLQDVLDQVEHVETPKAGEIRKALGPLLKSEFDSKLKSLGGGVWEAPFMFEATPHALVIDFGRFSRGLAYRIRPAVNDSSIDPFAVSYEAALGFGTSDWDLLRTDILEEQLGLLCRNIRKTLEWLARIDWSKRAGRAKAKPPESGK